jgi:Peptidase family M28/PDZ domain/PA domain
MQKRAAFATIYSGCRIPINEAKFMRIRRPILPATVLFLLGLLASAPLWADEAAEARLKKDITFLASDECEGRGVGTKGLDLAADYVAGQFAAAGLKPGAREGSYFQSFPYSRGAQLDGPATLVLDGPLGQTVTLKAGSDFQVSGLSGSGKVAAPVVFVGYGVTAPAIGYDDYAGVDVKGKIVIALRKVPRWTSKDAPFDGSRKDQHADMENKQALATINGALALILVNDSSDLADGDKLIPYAQLSRGVATFSLPFVQLRRNLAEEMFTASVGLGLRELEQSINRDLKPRSVPLPGWKVSLDVHVKRTVIPVKNIVGVLEGSGPLAKETLVIGAHYDHLGYGGPGSLAKNKDKAIHHGADDNGSGTTALMELARRFGADKNREGRRLVFIAFTAEESGLIGSRYYCRRHPLFPLNDTVAMVNLDMVGRLRTDDKSGKGKLLIEGAGTAKSFDAMLEGLNPGFQLSKRPGASGLFGSSDHESFYDAHVPVVFLWTGTHEDYHRPSDTSDKINVNGMSRIVDYAQKIVAKLSTDTARPEYVAIAPLFTPGKSKGPRLGIMPDYEADKEGVVVGGVGKGGPAEKGGLKAGDLIVAIAGKTVTNMNTYMAIMAQQTADQAIEVAVLRDGKKLLLKVTPQN